MATMAPLRCLGIKQVVLSDDGQAVLLELAMANGQIFPLELGVGGVELLSRALLTSAQALGEQQLPRAPLAETEAGVAVHVPAQAFEVRAQPDGGRMLLARVGCIDLGLDLADAAAAEGLAAALQAPRA
jgi:hypothetical protein